MPTSHQIVRLNVGGRIFETSRETLLLAGANSKFAEVLAELKDAPEICNGGAPAGSPLHLGSSPYPPSSPLPPASPVPGTPSKQELFFDRDPECFEHILFYLRTASLAGVRDMGTLEKLRVESQFYGLGPGFQDMLKGKERILHLTLKEAPSMRKEPDLKKTWIVRIQIKLKSVEAYVKWDIERNENIIRVAIGHRTHCSTQMRYQVTEGDTYNLQMTLNVITRLNETTQERLESHIVKCLKDQFNADIIILSVDEMTHCSYCERLIPSMALVDTSPHSPNSPARLLPTAKNGNARSPSVSGSGTPPSIEIK